jgi:hypothetical protein
VVVGRSGGAVENLFRHDDPLSVQPLDQSVVLAFEVALTLQDAGALGRGLGPLGGRNTILVLGLSSESVAILRGGQRGLDGRDHDQQDRQRRQESPVDESEYAHQ